MAAPSPAHFPRSRRLLEASGFQAVFRSGQRRPGAFFRLHVLIPNTAAQPRLGLAVPKKAVPRAFDRNRIKRQCREYFRQSQGLPPGDYVLVAQPAAAAASNAALREALQRLFSGLCGQASGNPAQAPETQ